MAGKLPAYYQMFLGFWEKNIQPSSVTVVGLLICMLIELDVSFIMHDGRTILILRDYLRNIDNATYRNTIQFICNIATLHPT